MADDLAFYFRDVIAPEAGVVEHRLDAGCRSLGSRAFPSVSVARSVLAAAMNGRSSCVAFRTSSAGKGTRTCGRPSLQLAGDCLLPRRHLFTIPPLVRGAVAQLGERCVRNAEVEGSIPFRSTNFPFSLVDTAPSRAYVEGPGVASRDACFGVSFFWRNHMAARKKSAKTARRRSTKSKRRQASRKVARTKRRVKARRVVRRVSVRVKAKSAVRKAGRKAKRTVRKAARSARRNIRVAKRGARSAIRGTAGTYAPQRARSRMRPATWSARQHRRLRRLPSQSISRWLSRGRFRSPLPPRRPDRSSKA